MAQPRWVVAKCRSNDRCQSQTNCRRNFVSRMKRDIFHFVFCWWVIRRWIFFHFGRFFWFFFGLYLVPLFTALVNMSDVYWAKLMAKKSAHFQVPRNEKWTCILRSAGSNRNPENSPRTWRRTKTHLAFLAVSTKYSRNCIHLFAGSLEFF